MAGLYLVGFAAPAFEAAACHVGETRNPAKMVPRAMLASGLIAGLFFGVLPVVWLGSLGSESLGRDLALVLGPTFAPLFGNAAKAAAVWFMVLSMFCGTLQPLAGAARTLSQLSEDGLLPRFLARRSRTDVPWAATLLTATMSIAFLMIGDPIWLIAAANFTYLIGIALPSVAVWLLRRDEPQLHRPYRAPRGTITLGLIAAMVWGLSALFGFEQFGLSTVLIGHSVLEVSGAAQRLATGTLADFSRAMTALGRGDLDGAHARVDITPVRINTRDEVGDMAMSFNTLQVEIGRAALGLDGAREGLRKARSDLIDVNARLEQRVEQLHRTEEKLSGVLDSIDNVVWSVSLGNNELLHLNSAAERLYGRPVDEFFTDLALWRSIVHPDDWERVHAHFSALKASKTLTIGYRIVRPDGSERWLEDRSRVINSADGTPVRIDGVTSDISERRRDAERLIFQAKAWHEAGHIGLSVAVNMSAKQFQQDVPALVREVLHDAGLPAHGLELELTESVLMHDTKATVETMRQLKNIGVRLALNDFGTGYSSLSYLKRFPIDVLKIDQSFAFEVTSDDGAASITRAVVAMACSLNMTTVAEGVETSEQLACLIAPGCDVMRGFHISRPVPNEQITALLDKDRLSAQNTSPVAHLKELVSSLPPAVGASLVVTI